MIRMPCPRGAGGAVARGYEDSDGHDVWSLCEELANVVHRTVAQIIREIMIGRLGGKNNRGAPPIVDGDVVLW